MKCARAAAAQVGIARSAFLPTLSAFAFGESLQQGIILEDGFHIEDLGLFQDGLQLNFTVLDFGQRASQLDVSRAHLLGANFGFNDTHRRIIFGVCRAYFRLIEAQGREQAARVADKTAFFSLDVVDGERVGTLVEYDDTEAIFARAADTSTRDYVNGRFG